MKTGICRAPGRSEPTNYSSVTLSGLSGQKPLISGQNHLKSHKNHLAKVTTHCGQAPNHINRLFGKKLGDGVDDGCGGNGVGAGGVDGFGVGGGEVEEVAAGDGGVDGNRGAVKGGRGDAEGDGDVGEAGVEADDEVCVGEGFCEVGNGLFGEDCS